MSDIDDTIMSSEPSDFEDDDSMADFPDDDSSVDDATFDEAVDTEDPKAEKRRAFEPEHKALAPQDLEKRQRDVAEGISGILSIKPEEAVILLRHWGWKRDKLLEDYMEDSDRCKTEAGLNIGKQPRLKRMRGFTCEICFDEDGSKETLALSCDHRFCRDCYTEYTYGKIQDGEAKRIQCMANDCPAIVDEKTVEMLMDEPTSLKYKRLLNRAYVDDSPSLRWCPAPDCTYAIECHVPTKSLESTVPSVRCACDNFFCFGCSLEDHRPCICRLAKLWLKKCSDDSETANWISANTKECPKCHYTIEKNGGCNHMTCKHCKYEFCWVCMGLWADHGTSWYNCNRFDEKEAAKDPQSQSRISLERYLFYYNRYANHEQSRKLDKEVYQRVERKMTEIQSSSNLSWIEVQFMKKAVDILTDCRGTLKWSYALAFYMARDNATELFEQNQANLEMAVENLSELIEKPIEAETIAELRAEVQNRSNYVKSRHDTMLLDGAEGLQEGRWNYTV